MTDKSCRVGAQHAAPLPPTRKHPSRRALEFGLPTLPSHTADKHKHLRQAAFRLPPTSAGRENQTAARPPRIARLARTAAPGESGESGAAARQCLPAGTAAPGRAAHSPHAASHPPAARCLGRAKLARIRPRAACTATNHPPVQSLRPFRFHMSCSWNLFLAVKLTDSAPLWLPFSQFLLATLESGASCAVGCVAIPAALALRENPPAEI